MGIQRKDVPFATARSAAGCSRAMALGMPASMVYCIDCQDEIFLEETEDLSDPTALEEPVGHAGHPALRRQLPAPNGPRQASKPNMGCFACQAEISLEEPEDLSDPMVLGERVDLPATPRAAADDPPRARAVALGAPEAQPPIVPITGGAYLIPDLCFVSETLLTRIDLLSMHSHTSLTVTHHQALNLNVTVTLTVTFCEQA